MGFLMRSFSSLQTCEMIQERAVLRSFITASVSKEKKYYEYIYFVHLNGKTKAFQGPGSTIITYVIILNKKNTAT